MQRSEDDVIRKEPMHKSDTMRYYMYILMNTNFTYGRGKNRWTDVVYMRLRFGYKYYWELGVSQTEEESKCRVCGALRSHTLYHYVICTFKYTMLLCR